MERHLHTNAARTHTYLFTSWVAQKNPAVLYVGDIHQPHGASCPFSTSRFTRPFAPGAPRQQEQQAQQRAPTNSAAPSPLQRQEPNWRRRPRDGEVVGERKCVGDEEREMRAGHPTSPHTRFFQDALLREGNLQYTKVSPQGSPDALFSECLDHLREKRYDLDPDIDTQPSPVIEKLTQAEREVVKKILQRVDPERKISPRLETRAWYIDPFWDPFKRVEDLQQQVAHDLTEFARLVGAAEARRQRLLLRASLRRHYRLHDPLGRGFRHYFKSAAPDLFPTPHRTHERFWDPTVDIRVALKNNNVPISWRDLHVLHHFVGENGLILPRRTTHASRYQQQCIFKAICLARRMALFPYDWKPTPGELMPIMDPLQYLADELTARYVATGDLRAEAMVRVMLAKYPKLNYRRYLQTKAFRSQSQRRHSRQQEEEKRGNFSTLLRKYKEGSFVAEEG